MKRTLLLIACAAFSTATFAQEVVVSDDIESYTVGQGITAQGFDNGWKLWNGNNQNFEAFVSDAQASSGTNSIHLLQTSTDDIVFDVGTPYTSGKYDVRFKMYIPSGKEGYFNLLHAWDLNTTTDYEWAVDVFFAANGNITWGTGAQQGGVGSFQHDEWFDMQVTVDLDADQGRLYHNGQVMHQWQWSLNNSNGNPGLNQLKAVNFYAFGPSQSNGDYYIDDFEIINSTGVSVSELVEPTVKVFPNPANEFIQIDLSGFNNPTITLYGIDGRIIDRFMTNQGALNRINVSHLSNGVYFIEVMSGNERLTQKVVIRH